MLHFGLGATRSSRGWWSPGPAATSRPSRTSPWTGATRSPSRRGRSRRRRRPRARPGSSRRWAAPSGCRSFARGARRRVLQPAAHPGRLNPAGPAWRSGTCSATGATTSSSAGRRSTRCASCVSAPRGSTRPGPIHRPAVSGHGVDDGPVLLFDAAGSGARTSWSPRGATPAGRRARVPAEALPERRPRRLPARARRCAAPAADQCRRRGRRRL
jgi:hypothetical protein